MDCLQTFIANKNKLFSNADKLLFFYVKFSLQLLVIVVGVSVDEWMLEGKCPNFS